MPTADMNGWIRYEIHYADEDTVTVSQTLQHGRNENRFSKMPQFFSFTLYRSLELIATTIKMSKIISAH